MSRLTRSWLQSGLYVYWHSSYLICSSGCLLARFCDGSYLRISNYIKFDVKCRKCARSSNGFTYVGVFLFLRRGPYKEDFDMNNNNIIVDIFGIIYFFPLHKSIFKNARKQFLCTPAYFKHVHYVLLFIRMLTLKYPNDSINLSWTLQEYLKMTIRSSFSIL